jgi:hypothetical protein
MFLRFIKAQEHILLCSENRCRIFSLFQLVSSRRQQNMKIVQFKFPSLFDGSAANTEDTLRHIYRLESYSSAHPPMCFAARRFQGGKENFRIES